MSPVVQARETAQSERSSVNPIQTRPRIQRTQEQDRLRLHHAKVIRQNTRQGITRSEVPIPANDNAKKATNDNETEQRVEQGESPEDRVNRLRFLRAQVLLASEEETGNQIEEEEREKPSPIRYVPAGTVALLKDILDFTFIGSLPVIGTLVSLLCSFLIFLLLFFTKKNGSISDMRMVLRRLLIITVGFIIEGYLFGINFFPFEIATVILIYFIDRHLSLKQIATLKSLLGNISKTPV